MKTVTKLHNTGLAVMSVLLAGSALLAASTPTSAPASTPDKLSEPTGGDLKEDKRLYGDDQCVKLLANALREDDELVREHAARDLGQVRNTAAVKPLHDAIKDTSALVRAAVVQSAAAYPASSQARDIVKQAFADTDDTVLYSAMRTVSTMQSADYADAVAGLLASKNTGIQAEALRTLSAISLAAKADVLAKLIKNESVIVRLRACQNARYLKNIIPLSAALNRIVADQSTSPALRAAAIETLGVFKAMEAGTLASASRDLSPLVRRAAVRAYTSQNSKQSLHRFLNDPSPLVQVAAATAAGELKRGDCAAGLFAKMIAAPLEPWHTLSLSNPYAKDYAHDMHLVARQSLKLIGDPSVIASATAYLAKVKSVASDGGKAPAQIQRRNIVACAWLLAELKSNAALDDIARLMATVPAEDLMMASLARALGDIGDRKAIAPLMKALKLCDTQANKYLADLVSGRMMNMTPYTDECSGQVMLALGRLKATEAYDAVMLMTRKFVYMPQAATWTVLDITTAYAMKALVMLVTPQKRAALDKLIISNIGNNAYALFSRLSSAKAAGKLKVAGGRKALQKLLNDPDKRTTTSIDICGWSLQQITGKTPKCPAPTIKQGDWIIRRIVKRAGKLTR